MGGYREDPESSMSVMDRLLVQRASGVIGEGSRYDELASLRRDLELLLNTHRRAVVIPEKFVHCASSILNFGVPDMVQYGDLNTPVERDRVCEALEKAIETFEPRLADVSIKLVPSDGRKFYHHFRMEATVVSSSQWVVWEMSLRRNTGAMSVKPGDN
jgi:type VI secretion system lysozyme-like protein